jgi:acetolactate synthase-1/2/3 large subunit
MDFRIFSEEFKASGGTQVFGIPGGGPSLQLMDELERSGACLVATGHESTAALMAGAAGRYTNKPALAVSIKGPGLMNMTPGLLCNSYEGYPMISVAEAYSPNDCSGRRHKWLDHSEIAGSYLRGFSGYRQNKGFFRECWNRATTEMPGPVHIDLSDAETMEPSFHKKQSSLWPQEDKSFKRPILIMGSAALRSAICRKQVALLKIPVFTTVSAKGLLDETSPYAAGIYTGDGSPLTPEKTLIPMADHVFCIGVHAGEILNPKPPHVCTDYWEVSGTVFPPNAEKETFLVNDKNLEDLFHKLAAYQWGEKEVLNAFEKCFSSLAIKDFNAAACMQLAMKVMPDAVHITDTGNFTVIAEHVLRIKTAQNFLGTPNGRFMGAGLGYALGVALCQQERPVILWIGDGGLRSYFSELALASEHPSRLCVLVMEDGYYGSIMGRASQMDLTQTPLTLSARNYLKAAEGLGLDSARAESEQDLQKILESWQKSQNRPLVVGCRFDPLSYRNQAQRLR